MRISDWSSDVCSSDLVHDQGGVDPGCGRVAQVQQLFAEGFEQRLRRGGVAEHVAHLAPGDHGLGERTQVQADDGALDPAAGVGDGVVQCSGPGSRVSCRSGFSRELFLAGAEKLAAKSRSEEPTSELQYLMRNT